MNMDRPHTETQQGTGSIAGSIVDPNGNVITGYTGAFLTLRNQATGTDDVTTGWHAIEFLLGRDPPRTRTGRLATHIDDVGTLIHHAHPMRDSDVSLIKLAAIAKGIGSDVQNTHH